MNYRIIIFASAVILTIAIIFNACTNIEYHLDPYFDDAGNPISQECDVLNVSYEETIMPVLKDYCVACHNANSAASGYDYSDYDGVILSVADGSLLGTIESGTGYSPMPPGTPLDSCSIEKIRAWITTLDPDSIPAVDSLPGDSIVSNCHPDTVYFRNTILPLVVSSCATTDCHDNVSHKDGIILTDYASIIRTGKIKPGDPEDSEFFETLTANGDDLMPPPPYEKLDSEQVELIRQWILQGAKDNSCNDGCDTSNVTFTATIWPMMQKYCTGCHSAANPGGGIVIAGHSDLVKLAQDGSLMGSVRWEQGYAGMPTNQQMSECDISLLQKWIDDGLTDK